MLARDLEAFKRDHEPHTFLLPPDVTPDEIRDQLRTAELSIRFNFEAREDGRQDFWLDAAPNAEFYTYESWYRASASGVEPQYFKRANFFYEVTASVLGATLLTLILGLAWLGTRRALRRRRSAATPTNT